METLKKKEAKAWMKVAEQITQHKSKKKEKD